MNRRLHIHSRLGRDDEIMKKGRIDKRRGGVSRVQEAHIWQAYSCTLWLKRRYIAVPQNMFRPGILIPYKEFAVKLKS